MTSTIRPSDWKALALGYRRLAGLLRDVVAEEAVEAVLARIVSTLRELVRCEDVVVWQMTAANELVVAAVDGEDEEAMRSLTVSLGEGLTGKAAREREPIVSNDAHLDPAAGHVPGTQHVPEAVACMPLLARERLLGVLTLYRRGEARAFEEREIELVSDFAAIAALALDNASIRSELELLATTDELTGVANRRAFMAQLEHEVAFAARYESPLSLLLLDLDNFKGINDVYGHGMGDRALQLVAEAVLRCLRAADIVARLGGDEFAVLLPNTLQHDAEDLAKRLVRSIALLPLPQLLTASVGVATLNTDAPGDLLEVADHFLYEAKRAQNSGSERGPGGVA